MAQEYHRSTARVLDILELLASADENGYTLTEIAELINAPKSSIFPIVHTLNKRHFISADKSSGKYSIGIGAFAVGSVFLHNQGLYDYIKNVMADVVNSCNEICQMGILDNNQVLYVAKVDSSESVRLISHVGKRLPAYCTALGKALLINKSYEEIIALYPDSKLITPITENTITDLSLLYNQLLTFRDEGITIETQESDMGIKCYAIPLIKDSVTIAAISVSVPLFRISDEKTDVIKKSLTKAKFEIEKLFTEFNSDINLFSM